ncbi:MAG TPA: TauD/TfdA family dioxygenase, partial [Labilithrix sp.]|nr:TauD/TfdA family dioxygenase [Labilithrix sp.]
MSTPQYEPLTASGRGAKISDRSFLQFSVEEIRELIARYQWLAFTKHPVSGDDVLAHLGKFGNLVQNDRRQKGILKIDGSKKEEVLLGEGFMPLHRDGALMGTNVALVGIYCVEYKEVTGGGRTFISDIENALKDERVPAEYVELIRERGIEGRPVDAYYTKPSDTWHAIAGFIEVGGRSYLNTGFPYRPGEKASWLVRIPGIEEERSQEIFETLRSVLMSEKYCYYHEWN